MPASRTMSALLYECVLSNTRPMMYGPMHSALVILVDVYERPDSVEAPRSRELIDQTFALSAPESGIVGGPNGVTVQRPLREGGVEAWDMLRGLRSAAWQKAGLDPTVLWTEADQVAVGVATPLTDAQKIAQSLREDCIYDDQHTIAAAATTAAASTTTNAPSANNPKPAAAATVAKSSEAGVRYMVKLAQNELVNGSTDEHDGYPCSRAMRNQFLKHIENDARLDRSRGLARREGQQPMPFPLSGRMEACSGRAANGDHHPGEDPGPSRCSKGAAHHPTLQMLGCPNNLGRIPSTGPSTEQVPPVPHPGQTTAEFAMSAPTHQEGLVDGPTTTTHGYTNGYQNGHVDHQFDTNTKPAEPASHQFASATDPSHRPPTDETPSTNSSIGELGFDWERWDAVFGQFSGFTDMMDDVTWEDVTHD